LVTAESIDIKPTVEEKLRSWVLHHLILCNLWLARAFNAQDAEAASAMYHPDASIVRVDDIHGETQISRGAQDIRETMAAYIGMKPHMDVVTHHTTIAGDFAMTRSQWLITGVDKNGKEIEVHHHGMEVHRRLPDGTWVFFIDHPLWGRSELGRGPSSANGVNN
jgi:ketosteroid isomerase-like protein